MSDTPLRIAIIGGGLMGKAVHTLADERGLQVVGTLDRAAMINKSDSTNDVLTRADVALEFSTPDSAIDNIRVCLSVGCPVVVGTTGWYKNLETVKTEVAAKSGSLLWAPNFSVGVALLTKLAGVVGQLAAKLDQFDVQLVETHHQAKRDTPSGTAASLQRAITTTLGKPVPITSIRTGFVPGTHELTLDGPFERITLSHEARDRRVFADGALIAAAWLNGRTGVFTMEDVFDMEDK